VPDSSFTVPNQLAVALVNLPEYERKESQDHAERTNPSRVAAVTKQCSNAPGKEARYDKEEIEGLHSLVGVVGEI
jgi:hypothetical protein